MGCRRGSTPSSSNAPPGRPALYEAKIEELWGSFAAERTIHVGDTTPDFSLPDAQGNPVSLLELRRGVPVVVTVYRGGWCPYCNLQLGAYQVILPQIYSVRRPSHRGLAAAAGRLADYCRRKCTDVRRAERRRKQHRVRPLRARLLSAGRASRSAVSPARRRLPASRNSLDQP